VKKRNPSITLSQKKPLSSLSFWREWPMLPLEHLAFMELKQDEVYTFIPQEKIYSYIKQAIQIGTELANRVLPSDKYTLTSLINDLMKQGIKIRFLPKHPTNIWVRAQYTHHPPTIHVYRSSLDQIHHFFQQTKETVIEEDLITLHLYHEWYHHLEEKRFGRTDLKLPKVVIKQWGPILLKKTVYRTREIAAHAFTQTAMKLDWSPLLLDHLLLLSHEGWSRSQIREHFQQIRQEVKQLQTLAESTTP
jgi:hypothetical protein